MFLSEEETEADAEEVISDDTLEYIFMAAQIVDPTGVTSWPDVYRAGKAVLDKGASKSNIIDLGFAVLSAIPLVGKSTTIASSVKKLDRIANLNKVSRQVQRAGGDTSDILKKIEKIKRGIPVGTGTIDDLVGQAATADRLVNRIARANARGDEISIGAAKIMKKSVEQIRKGIKANISSDVKLYQRLFSNPLNAPKIKIFLKGLGFAGKIPGQLTAGELTGGNIIAAVTGEVENFLDNLLGDDDDDGVDDSSAASEEDLFSSKEEKEELMFSAVSKQARHPRLRISVTNGKYSIEYFEDSLGLMKPIKKELNSEIQRLFGYEGWEQYKKENWEDIRPDKKVIRDDQMRVRSAPTYWPFHAAYALEEFVRNFDQDDYKAVFVTKDDLVKFAKFPTARINFVGNDDGKGGIWDLGLLGLGLFSPQEGLSNKDPIKHVAERAISSLVKSMNVEVFNMSNEPTGERVNLSKGMFTIAKVAEGGTYFLMAKGHLAQVTTPAENLLIKRLGINTNISLGMSYRQVLVSAKTEIVTGDEEKYSADTPLVLGAPEQRGGLGGRLGRALGSLLPGGKNSTFDIGDDAVSGPLAIAPKRAGDFFKRKFKKDKERLSEMGIRNLEEFYKEIRKCFYDEQYLVLHEQDMDYEFGEKHREALKILLNTKKDKFCFDDGRKEVNPHLEKPYKSKLQLINFQGYKSVQPANVNKSWGQGIVIDFLKDLSNTNDGVWRIGDISTPTGGKSMFHSSHQTGLDLDVAIPKDDGGFTIYTKEEDPAEFKKDVARRGPTQGMAVERRGWSYTKANAKNINIPKSIEIIKLAIDYNCHMILLDISLSKKIRSVMSAMDKAGRLDNKYMSVVNRGFLKHADAHTDHFHIRFPPLKELNLKGAGRGNNIFLNKWSTPEKLVKFLDSELYDENLQDKFLFPVQSAEYKKYTGGVKARPQVIANLSGVLPVVKNTASGKFTPERVSAVKEVARSAGVPESVVAGLMMKESSGNPTVVAGNPRFIYQKEASEEIKKQLVGTLAEKRGKAGKPAYGDDAREVFREVYQVSPKWAVRIMAWGWFQIMGINAMQEFSDDAATNFYKEFTSDPERASINAAKEWWKSNPRAVTFAKEKDFEGVTRIYFGNLNQEYKATVEQYADEWEALDLSSESDVPENYRSDEPKETEFPNYSREGGEPKYSFIVGDLESGGKIYRKLNENSGDMGHGASMPKPILALVQLIKYKDEPEKQLTEEELRAMLSYHKVRGVGSNYMSKVVTGRKKRHAKRLGREIGTVSKQDTVDGLKKLGLDPSMEIRFNSANKQTPRQYFDFMRLIHNKSKAAELGVEKEIKKVLGYMSRTGKGLKITAKGVGGGGDRESARWPGYIKALKEAGYRITSLYGKGGLITRGFHYSLVINDKYLVTLYTIAHPGTKLYGGDRTKDQLKKSREHHKWFKNKLVEILDGVVPRSNVEVNENLKTIFKLIDGAAEDMR